MRVVGPHCSRVIDIPLLPLGGIEGGCALQINADGVRADAFRPERDSQMKRT